MITIKCTLYSEKSKTMLIDSFKSLRSELSNLCQGQCRKCEYSRLCDDTQRVLEFLDPVVIPDDLDVHK